MAYTQKSVKSVAFTLSKGFAIPANGRKTIDASRRYDVSNFYHKHFVNRNAGGEQIVLPVEV